MVNTATELSLKPNWFARLIGANAATFSVKKDGIELKHLTHGSYQVLPCSLANLNGMAVGWFFSTLHLSTDKGPIKLKGLHKNELKRVYQILRKHWYQSLVNDVVKSRQSLDLAMSLGYLRTSRWKMLQKQAVETTDKFITPPEKGLICDNAREVFVYVHALAHLDEFGVDECRTRYIKRMSSQYKGFFDVIESNPLTDAQREACIIDEDNNLVLAGAGTGKTSTLIGRVGFLVKSKQASPRQILLLAYGKKAADEMKERLHSRVGIDGIHASTFHALGQHIITTVEGSKPSVSPLAQDEALLERHVDRWFTELMEDECYRHQIFQYFENYLYPSCNSFDFSSEGEYFDFLITNEVRTLKGEAVKSYEECLIANQLFRLGVNYQYEANYEVNTSGLDYRQYQPDFYLPDYGIYIEHYGTDRDGNTAPWIDRELYNQGIEWKRELHEKNKTTLVETYHYEQIEGTLLSGLEKQLAEQGVIFDPLPDEAILETLREFGSINAFSKLLKSLLLLVKANGSSPDQLDLNTKAAKNADQMDAALHALTPIYERYEALLREQGDIDFNDMIGKALDYVNQRRFKSPWTYILVDEFQDISAPRAQLVMALRDALPNSSLFCVGDDWQAIYRFAGSDLSYTTNFADYFGDTKTSILNKTFRFNNSISDISTRFVTQNPKQVKKKITTHTQVNKPAVSLLRHGNTGDSIDSPIEQIIQKLADESKQNGSIFILARFNYLLPNRAILDSISRRHPQISIQAMSIHASKGKEADDVVIMDLVKGPNGFPSQKVTHPLLDALLPIDNLFVFAEERRLFYVALTRAKRRVYLVTDMRRPSVFISEMMEQKYPIELDEFDIPTAQQDERQIACPQCKTGTLVIRSGKKGSFLACSHFPLCHHTEQNCLKCKSPMTLKGRHRVCISPQCQQSIPVCPKCGADMVQRKGPSGQFWGCRNYRGKQDVSCGHTEQKSSRI